MKTDVWINKVCVKFPFEPYECQRTFMKNVVDVLDSKMDAALESPTGTGKTLSLLCSTLAWVQKQKEMKPPADWQMEQGEKLSLEGMKSSFIPTIYYASRTHSQLEQVVHELNRTDYNWVQTTILGSREHFCINQKVKNIKESNRQSHVCRGMVSKRKCHFYNKFDTLTKDKMAELISTGKAMDIEEFVKVGTTHSICPYFMSRQRSENAELILLPYNYVIDPKMRRRYKLDLKNSIVIFDEAHNLESICESNASAEITSTDIALCIAELKKVLALLVEEEETERNAADITTEAFGSVKIDPAKKLIESLRVEDLMAVLEKIFSIEEEFETTWKSNEKLKHIENLDGKAANGEVLLEVFEKVGLNGSSIERIIDIMRNAVTYLLSKGEEVTLTEKGDGMEKLCDFVLSIFSTHAQEVAAAVGDSNMKLADRVDPRIVAKNCRLFMKKEANGKTIIKYFCFQASISMRMLKMRGVRNVLLASGTLSPIQSFTYNMGLNFGTVLENEHALKTVPVISSVVMKGYRGGIMGSYANRTNPNYLADVAETLIRVLEETPQGVIVFFSSYSQMDDLIKHWQLTKRANNVENFWEKMCKLKNIVVEPRMKDELATVRANYVKGVRGPVGAALFAVCRGKVSEGIDFCDAESRAVVIIGLPYPPINDERVVLKKMFLDDCSGKNQQQSSKDWYQMEAFRAVNQAIGRVLRHKDDFGVVVLIDSRYGTAKLEMFPKWLRKTITRGDINECAGKIARFFGERKELVDVSKSSYLKRIEGKKGATLRRAKQEESSNTSNCLSQISLDELFSTQSTSKSTFQKENVKCEPDTSPASSSGFFLPTNEDEISGKMVKEKTEILPTTINTFRKRPISTNTIGMKSDSPKPPPIKRKIVVLNRNDGLPPKYEEALKITTSQIISQMSPETKKQFASTLKAYKNESIQWQEVFDCFKSIFVPNQTDLFIGCSNILRPEDRSKFLKQALEKKIY